MAFQQGLGSPELRQNLVVRHGRVRYGAGADKATAGRIAGVL
jgi:hypothetical protein